MGVPVVGNPVVVDNLHRCGHSGSVRIDPGHASPSIQIHSGGCAVTQRVRHGEGEPVGGQSILNADLITRAVGDFYNPLVGLTRCQDPLRNGHGQKIFNTCRFKHRAVVRIPDLELIVQWETLIRCFRPGEHRGL